MSKMMEIFKIHNPNWESIRVIMYDKDMTEREIFTTSFPAADLLICLFHTFRSFRCEIVVERWELHPDNRICVWRCFNNWRKYQELYKRFCECAPTTVVEYFNENWHPIRKQWTMGI